MANFDAIKYEPFEHGIPEAVFVIGNNDDTLATALDIAKAYKLGQINKTEKNNIISNLEAVKYGAYEDAILFTTYLVPNEINSGLITENEYHDLILWNAYREAKPLTTINQINTDGTELDIVSEIPVVIPSSRDIPHILTIFKDGSPVQNSQYVYVVGTDIITLIITGIRLVSFDYEPNWKKEVNIRYEFKTIVSTTEKFFEQRRPLFKHSKRSQECLISEKTEIKEKLLNDLRELSTQIIAIPVFNEALINRNDLKDSYTATFDEDISKFYNMQNIDLVLVKEIKDIEKKELKEIESRDSNSINFKTKISTDIKANDGVIYPCFTGIIDKVSISAETPDYIDVNITFREVQV